MKKILVPIDFSEVSENAFVHALEMAKVFDTEIVLLHTYELPVIDGQTAQIDYAVLYDSIEHANSDLFKKELVKLNEIVDKHHAKHVVLKHVLTEGGLVYAIKKCIEKEGIDLVVMGTSGASGWFESMIGTNTGSIIADVQVPVLSIPKDAQYTPIDTLGFTTRFRAKDKIALEQVVFWSKKLNAQVKCLYVQTSDSDVTDKDIEDWKEHFKNENNLEFYIVPDDDVKTTIEDFIIDEAIDVLVMLTYKRSFFESLFTTTTTQKLAQYIDTPILALHG